MQVLIIEDEKPAARHLSSLLRQLRPQIAVLDVLDSVKGAVGWLQTFPQPELLFVDIQLADGLSFDIFSKLKQSPPVIFTTAYDHYALQAFKLNSVDYLLKPIDRTELQQALSKFEQSRSPFNMELLEQLRQSIHQPKFKERFLIKLGQQLHYLPVTEIRYFYSEDGLVRLVQQDGKKHQVDYTLDQLENLLSPDYFYRINRKFIIHLEAIHKIHLYFNSRLKLELHPSSEDEVIVSRDRVTNFKNWLDR